MIVIDLVCISSHRFEGWFASGEAFETQLAAHMVNCPRCGSLEVTRLPSGPRVAKYSAAQATTEKPSETEVLSILRKLVEGIEDVGSEFAEEARKIHYGEVEARGIRGVATIQETADLLEEGVPVLPLPVPPKGETH